MEASKLVRPGICLRSTSRGFSAVQEELESLQQELIVLELFSEIYYDEEQYGYIRLKKSQIGQLEEILEELKVDFPQVEDEIEHLRQELIALEQLAKAHGDKEQRKLVDGKKFQIGQLEEVLEELFTKLESSEMLKNAEQSPSVVTRTLRKDMTDDIVCGLLGIIVWLAILLALVNSHW